MKTLGKILAAVGFAVLTACTIYAERQVEPTPPTMFEVACTELRVDCSEIDKPTVIYSEVPTAYGAMGMYIHGEPYVYVNPLLADRPWKEIELHETVHYVMHEAGLPMSKCATETAARVITARVFNKEIDPTWRERYRCPAP